MQVDANGFIMVMDVRNFRVYVMDEGGVPLFAFGSSGDRQLDWSDPLTCHMGRDGTLQIYEDLKIPLIRRYEFRSPGPLRIRTFDRRTGTGPQPQRFCSRM